MKASKSNNHHEVDAAGKVYSGAVLNARRAYDSAVAPALARYERLKSEELSRHAAAMSNIKLDFERSLDAAHGVYQDAELSARQLFREAVK